MEQTGERSVRFTFNTEDRELALLAGLRPILEKAQWEGVDFAESGTSIVPITSAPYIITDFEAGRFVALTPQPGLLGRRCAVPARHQHARRQSGWNSSATKPPPSRPSRPG